MIKLRLPVLVLFPALAATHVLAASTKYQEGDTTLAGSEFHYAIFLDEPGAEQQRHIEVQHSKEKYDGPLAEMSFRDRHLQVLKMVFQLTKDSCPSGVGSLGNIFLSRDPESDEDPDAAHPQYVALQYSCK